MLFLHYIASPSRMVKVFILLINRWFIFTMKKITSNVTVMLNTKEVIFGCAGFYTADNAFHSVDVRKVMRYNWCPHPYKKRGGGIWLWVNRKEGGYKT